MKRKLAATVLVLFFSHSLAASAAGQTFDLSWHSLDGGGGVSSGGGFELAGTIGQPDAGVVLSGGGFELVGGFWAAAASSPPVPGDTDGDGDVDLTDLAVVLAAFGSCAGDPGYNPNADFDGSGCVDLTDLALLLANYGT